MTVPFPWPAGTIVVCINDKQCAAAQVKEGNYYTVQHACVEERTVDFHTGKVAYNTSIVRVNEIDCAAVDASLWLIAERFKPAESAHDERVAVETLSVGTSR